MLNLPNLLTVFRILLVPLLVVVLLTKSSGKESWGLGLFLLAALTDVLDGFLARRRQQVTRLGTLLDPAADKILTSAAFISLVELGPGRPAWIVVVVIVRASSRSRRCALRRRREHGGPRRPVRQDQDRSSRSSPSHC